MAARRKKLGLSMREIARKMGLSAAYLSDLELGRRNWHPALVAHYLKAIGDK